MSNPTTNRGVLVKLADETTPQVRANFLSSEGDEPELRPELVVTYLETTPESTYHAPATPDVVESNSTMTVPVTLTNTTAASWSDSDDPDSDVDWVLSYRWSRADGTEVSTTPLQTALPVSVDPGDTVTVQAEVEAPPPSTEGNERTDHVLDWDLFNTTTGTWLSADPTPANRVGALTQSLAVEESTSDQVGLEAFYAYAGRNTGAGSSLMNNLHAGNAVWSYDVLSNPSRGLSTFLRLAYNSKFNPADRGRQER